MDQAKDHAYKIPTPKDPKELSCLDMKMIVGGRDPGEKIGAQHTITSTGD